MNKSEQLVINLEPVIMELVDSLADKDGCSRSAYGRRLIIRDLHARGLLPEVFAVGLLAGAVATGAKA